MGATIYTYTFPFREPSFQEAVVREIFGTVKGSQFSRILNDYESQGSFLIRESNNHLLSMLLPKPSLSEENPNINLSERYGLAMINITRENPGTQNESIHITEWAIYTNREEYLDFIAKGRVGTTATLARAAIESGEVEPKHVATLWPHLEKTPAPRSFSESGRRSLHKVEIQTQIGRAVGKHLWEQYAEALTQTMLSNVPRSFRLFKVRMNSGQEQFANSQYVGAWENKFLIVCEELAYEPGGDAIPRYAVIPTSTFSHDIYEAVGVAMEMGLDVLNAPGLNFYMKMRPSLSAPMGECMSRILLEAMSSAEAQYQ